MILKCKMCGGDLPLTEGRNTLECEYCGTRQTIPSADSEKKLTLFNRANRLRMGAEFDKATGVYESIVTEYPQEAEAYWGLCLCAYGIEYVDDPRTGEKIPTCHRTRPESILDSTNFQMACEHADAIAKRIYRREANAIDALQRDILTIVAKESPYDVFICYKETGEDGERTQDSVLAQEIYDKLTDRGLKVFFARITLEDKLGKEYEPYIYAALHSARVMLAIGTSYEHFDAVWVKNEWSRFLDMAKEDKGKVLIPCYRDLDAYDLPKAMRGLQAQDMGKLGFLQDIVRGVEKLLGKTAASAQSAAAPVQAATGPAGVSVQSLMRRAQLFLEDGEWVSADEYLNKVLDIDPEHAPAYIGKVLVEYKLLRVEQISAYKEPGKIEFDGNWKKAMRFATPEQKAVYQGYLDEAKRAEKLRQEKAEEALRRAKGGKKRRRAEEESRLAQKKARQRKRNALILTAMLLIAEAGCLYGFVIEPFMRYSKAEKLLTEGQYEQARVMFSDLEDYKDASERVPETYYEQAEKLLGDEKYEEAAVAFQNAGSYSDAEQRIGEMYYLQAEKLLGEEKYGEAAVAFQNAGSYSDAEQRISETYYLQAEKLLGEEKYDEAAYVFMDLGSYKDSQDRLGQLAEILEKDGKPLLAALIYRKCGGAENLKRANELLISGRIAAGYSCTVGLKADGSVVAVGYNGSGQCEVNDWKDIVAIATETYRTVGLKADGSVVAVGANRAGQCEVSDWKDVVSVAVGESHTVGLKADGSVVAVGANRDGECEVSDWKDVVSVAAGESHTVGLKADGSVVAVGANRDGECEVRDWKDVVSVAVGDFHTVGLKADGSVVAVGANRDGECEVSDWKDVVSVAAGINRTVELKADGSVVAVGSNEDGECEVSDWKNIVSIAIGGRHTVGLKADGSVVAVGYNGDGRCEVSDWKDIVAIAAGSHHTVGLKADGSVVAVGYNDDGQCDVEDWNLGPLN